MKTEHSVVQSSNTEGAKEEKVNIIQKVKDDKIAIARFLRGEISIHDIDARGIKFVKPI